ncbi:hypothetical protein FQN50_007757 [Emmonsiellopsis sp. PD_5]|nr:hypothetical protein FQN50_007757 [Emmonsiellopsis sp. PD_5]
MELSNVQSHSLQSKIPSWRKVGAAAIRTSKTTKSRKANAKGKKNKKARNGKKANKAKTDGNGMESATKAYAEKPALNQKSIDIETPGNSDGMSGHPVQNSRNIDLSDDNSTSGDPDPNNSMDRCVIVGDEPPGK